MLKTRNLRKQAKPICVFFCKRPNFFLDLWFSSDCFPALLAIAFTGRVKCLSNAPGGGSDLNRAIVLHYHLVSRTKASTSSQGSIWQYQQWLDSVWNWNGVLSIPSLHQEKLINDILNGSIGKRNLSCLCCMVWRKIQSCKMSRIWYDGYVRVKNWKVGVKSLGGAKTSIFWEDLCNMYKNQ